MRVVSINALSQIPKFKGLWGKEQWIRSGNELDTLHKKLSVAPSLGAPDTLIIKPYYPFLDETAATIEDVKTKSHSYIDVCFSYGYVDADVGSHYQEEVCRVETKLPFKKAEWDLYAKNKRMLTQDTLKYIEQSLKRFGLINLIK